MSNSLPPPERYALLQTLNALPVPTFEELVFALKVPNSIMPGGSAPQGIRGVALVSWAESPIGCGLGEVQSMLSRMLPSHTQEASPRTPQVFQSASTETPTSASPTSPKHELDKSGRIKEVNQEIYRKEFVKDLRSQKTPSHKFSENDTSDQPQANYSLLHKHLEKGEWKKADLETIQIILQVAEQPKEGWVKKFDIFFSSDIHMLDQLWLTASEDKFGFSAQKDIWLEVNRKLRGFNAETFRNFGNRVGWYVGGRWIRHYEEMEFSLDAPKGHLPSLRFPRAEDGANWFLIWRASLEGILSFYI